MFETTTRFSWCPLFQQTPNNWTRACGDQLLPTSIQGIHGRRKWMIQPYQFATIMWNFWAVKLAKVYKSTVPEIEMVGWDCVLDTQKTGMTWLIHYMAGYFLNEWTQQKIGILSTKGDSCSKHEGFFSVSMLVIFWVFHAYLMVSHPIANPIGKFGKNSLKGFMRPTFLSLTVGLLIWGGLALRRGVLTLRFPWKKSREVAGSILGHHFRLDLLCGDLMISPLVLKGMVFCWNKWHPDILSPWSPWG